MAMDDDGFVDINLDEVDDGREPLPDGVVEMRVVSVEKKQKEGAGKYPYLDLRLSPMNGDMMKRKFMHILSFHPEALWNLKLFVKGTGVEFTPKGFNYKDLLNKTVAVTTRTEETPEGDKRNKFQPPYHRI